MSGRLLALALLLSVVSAVVGAGAAFLLRASQEPAEPAAEVGVAASEPAQAQAAPPTAVEQPAQPQPSSTGQTDPQELDQAADPPPAHAAPAVPAEPEEPAEPESVQPPPGGEGASPQEAASVGAEPTDQAVLTPTVIVQGEAFALTLESQDANAASATVAGRSWDLRPTADGSWWGIIAVPRDADIGVTEVMLDLYGEGGVWLRAIKLSIVVLASAAPLEDVVLGGTGAAADPAEVARDIAVRFSDHTVVSGPPRWQGAWLLPVEGEVTGVFGAKRSYDGVAADGWHHGHDIAAQHGDPIVAPAHGAVVWTGELVLHGMGVIIDHGAGVYSGYWHMSLVAVRVGHEVAPGDWLGNIGTTGLSTGPHLHWEVIVQGIDVDPVQWLGADRPTLPPSLVADPASADRLE